MAGRVATQRGSAGQARLGAAGHYMARRGLDLQGKAVETRRGWAWRSGSTRGTNNTLHGMAGLTWLGSSRRVGALRITARRNYFTAVCTISRTREDNDCRRSFASFTSEL